MIIRELKIILSHLPDDMPITIPFPFPDKEELKEHEPFVLTTGDGAALIIPQPLAEIFMEENSNA